MAEDVVGAGRYRAFISYSHKDAAMGRWLHRKLEAYRLPRRLVGGLGERGPVPARLTPIFRDREELPAAGDLSETVRAALAASETLIVLCSPDAAASPWVAKEIATFRALHPTRPILAAIVAGDPGICFPAALTGGGTIEPLAADLRPGRDGKRLGVLKLVAGLAGTGLDALVQRDAQRRMRRVTYVTAAALAAVLAMAVLTAVAVGQRREAQRQRAEAEGLVEFMLTDLRDRLKGVGRLDVMQAVNERALGYYKAPSGAGETLESELRRARLLRAIGDDFLTTGELNSAALAYARAYSITAAAATRKPADRVARLEHARSEYGVGRVYELRGDWGRAERQYRTFAATTNALLAASPNDVELLKEAAWSFIDLGNIEMNGRQNGDAAEALYRQGIVWFERALAAQPGEHQVTMDLANAHAWLADRYYFRSEWQKALDERTKQYVLMRNLSAAEPANFETSYRAALAERGLGRTYMKAGDVPAAAELEARAYASAAALNRHDPRNAEWRLFGAFVACDLLFGSVERPAGVGPSRLRRDIVEASAALHAEKNPRASELDGCVAASRQH